MMHGVILEAAGVATGVVAYAVGKGLLAVRDAHRASARSDRRRHVDGLLAPYDHLTVVPIPVRDDLHRELPANVLRLRPRDTN